MNHPTDPLDAAIEQGLRRSRGLEDAPEPVIRRALDLWQLRRQTAAEPALLQRILAVLTFDSGAVSPLAFGMRSAGGTTRQLLFSTGGHDIDLRIGPSGDTHEELWQLSGQLLGPEAQARVTLSDAQGSLLGESTLSELGEFHLPAIKVGSYQVSLWLSGCEVVLPAIAVPQAV